MMTMIKRFTTLLVILLLASCSLAADDSTNISKPSPTVTLDSMLIKDGDLPAGFSSAQIRDIAPGRYSDLPDCKNIISQQFEKDGHAAGGVTVFRYSSYEDMERAYDLIVDGMTDDAEPSDMVGEKSHVLSFSKGPIVTVKVAEVVFVKCNTLVSISMVGTDNTTSVIAYAKRLESRLEPLVCH